jgi:hypothetical protein
MVQNRMILAARRAKVKKGVHILRHTFCSHLSMRGAPARAIQELAGHADLAMIQRYMHLTPAALDAAIALLDEPSGDQSCGDTGNRGPGSETINGSEGLTGGEAGIRTRRVGSCNSVSTRDFWC